MPNPPTVDLLFDLAIQAERNAEDIYHRMAAAFAHCPEVADFWAGYASQETAHANWLEGLRQRIPINRLVQPADPYVWQMAERVTAISVDELFERIENLQDAFELANEMEHGETNAVFEFILTHFVDDEAAFQFARRQLHEHLAHLNNGLSDQFRLVTTRWSIKAIYSGER